jgi:hypothetical protein
MELISPGLQMHVNVSGGCEADGGGVVRCVILRPFPAP